MNPPFTGIIACGTDFSPNASQAGIAAAALAKMWGKRLVLVHATDEFEGNSGTKRERDDCLSLAREPLEAEAARLAATGAVVTAEVLHGGLAEQAILSFVANHSVDLVVVSAVSKTRFDRWTLGSVSERVAEAAPAATLVVRVAAPFAAWAGGDRALKIFVAADFSASSEAALRWVGDLCRLGPCQVTVAYVNWPPEDRERLGVTGPLGLTENPPEIQFALERELREKVTAVLGGHEAEIQVRVGWGRVDALLVDLADEAGADLLVMGTHQRRGLERWTRGSVSRGVLRHSLLNVACVPVMALT